MEFKAWIVIGMIGRVLFPVDFSNVCDYALKNCMPKFFSTGVAEELILLHVIDVHSAEEFGGIEKLEERAKERLREMEEYLKGKGVKVSDTVVRIGTPAIEIAKAAEEMADLIFMPSKGENVLRDVLIGNTASNVARASKKPVLLVRYEWDKARRVVKGLWDAERVFERPVIALDFSECSGVIVETVKSLIGDRVKRATLVHVIDYGKPEEIDLITENALKELKGYADGLGFECDLEIGVGEASSSIINEAVVKGATIIVVGKRGRSVIKDLIMGSTADGIMRRSILPVLLVPCKR